jgi:hypothetical protein
LPSFNKSLHQKRTTPDPILLEGSIDRDNGQDSVLSKTHEELTQLVDEVKKDSARKFRSSHKTKDELTALIEQVKEETERKSSLFNNSIAPI